MTKLPIMVLSPSTLILVGMELQRGRVCLLDHALLPSCPSAERSLFAIPSKRVALGIKTPHKTDSRCCKRSASAPIISVLNTCNSSCAKISKVAATTHPTASESDEACPRPGVAPSSSREDSPYTKQEMNPTAHFSKGINGWTQS